ncbi:hypothetical protein BpHYR1_025320 [Brachionus plicatilis]|uniref:Uncharacterized protein n=1 Tax=Brachionus plicatilis TaxID=10195 RepID=A0A3M7PMV9_BRAPC|nr:hypothetical protein BpHYR1_025320 [Brachionus plicatilis]
MKIFFKDVNIFHVKDPMDKMKYNIIYKKGNKKSLILILLARKKWFNLEKFKFFDTDSKNFCTSVYFEKKTFYI